MHYTEALIFFVSKPFYHGLRSCCQLEDGMKRKPCRPILLNGYKLDFNQQPIKYAEAHGVQEAGLLISVIYDAEKSYSSSFFEVHRYQRIKMEKKAYEVKDEKIEAKKQDSGKDNTTHITVTNIHAEAFRMDCYKVK